MTEDVKSEVATPTSDLKFVNGELHQLFVVQKEDGSSAPEWRPVPQEGA
jgi:hypothetical protein